MSEFSVRSMVAPLRRVAVRTPVTEGDFAGAYWQRTPDGDALVAEHAAFVALLEGLGAQVDVLPAAPGLVDAVYAYDAVFVTGRGAIVLNQVKPARAAEPERSAEDYAALGVPILGRLSEAAIADGGDFLWLDEHTLCAARGFRTNQAAHDEFRRLLEPEGVEVLTFDSPAFLGSSAVIHLMSYVSLVSDRLAVIYQPLIPVALLQELERRGFELVRVSEDEFNRQGCNILATAPDQVVIFDRLPEVTDALRGRGVDVQVIDCPQLTLGDGGPTCLTRPLLRR